MEDGLCGATTQAGGTCRNRAAAGATCHIHGGPTCSICFVPLLRGTRQLPCGHTFHTRCIERWKRSCPAGFTCPMCREPFDMPTYRCRLIIQRVTDGATAFEDFAPTNIQQIMEGFGLNFRPSSVTFLADIHFDVEETEDLREELLTLQLPVLTIPRLTP
jgi:hypothetical protein